MRQKLALLMCIVTMLILFGCGSAVDKPVEDETKENSTIEKSVVEEDGVLKAKNYKDLVKEAMSRNTDFNDAQISIIHKEDYANKMLLLISNEEGQVVIGFITYEDDNWFWRNNTNVYDSDSSVKSYSENVEMFKPTNEDTFYLRHGEIVDKDIVSIKSEGTKEEAIIVDKGDKRYWLIIGEKEDNSKLGVLMH